MTEKLIPMARILKEKLLDTSDIRTALRRIEGASLKLIDKTPNSKYRYYFIPESEIERYNSGNQQ